VVVVFPAGAAVVETAVVVVDGITDDGLTVVVRPGAAALVLELLEQATRTSAPPMASTPTRFPGRPPDGRPRPSEITTYPS
jgi:hypothetical protein